MMVSKPGEVRYYSQRWAPNLWTSALAGLIASIPMGIAMIGLNRLTAKGKPTAPEPPKQITEEMAKRAGVEEAVPTGKAWGVSTWLGHLGYGAAAASLYPLTTYRLPLPNFFSGMLFAMGVWAGSYMGWLPAFNILPPADQQPMRRNVIMIGVHLLWGSLLGLLMRLISARQVPHDRIMLEGPITFEKLSRSHL